MCVYGELSEWLKKRFAKSSGLKGGSSGGSCNVCGLPNVGTKTGCWPGMFKNVKLFGILLEIMNLKQCLKWAALMDYHL